VTTRWLWHEALGVGVYGEGRSPSRKISDPRFFGAFGVATSKRESTPLEIGRKYTSKGAAKVAGRAHPLSGQVAP